MRISDWSSDVCSSDLSLGGNAAMRGAWFASVSDGLYGQLATKYRSRYGKAPYRLASLGYDSVLLTVRIARDWKPGTSFPVNRLMAADGFGGIDGIFRFDNRGIAQRALEVSEVGAGGFRGLDPGPVQWSARSETHRGGKGCVSTCRYRGTVGH